jgi:hypothetical protein
MTHRVATPLPSLITPLPFLATPLPFLVRPLPFLATPIPFLATPIPLLATPLPFLAPTHHRHLYHTFYSYGFPLFTTECVLKTFLQIMPIIQLVPLNAEATSHIF